MKKRKLTAAIGALLGLALLAGCGDSYGSYNAKEAAASAPMYEDADYYDGGDYAMEEAAVEEAAADESAPEQE